MSLVTPYVQSKEGRWYKYPVVRHEDYYVCWDDDEPIELVVKEEKISIKDALEDLKSKGWDIRVIPPLNVKKSRRWFTKTLKDKPLPAEAVFVIQNHGPPESLLSEYDESYDEMPQTPGVFYQNKRIG